MSRSSQRGFALAGAVFGLVIIATLVAGAFFVARQEMSVGRNNRTFASAFEAAEAGLNRTVAAWNTSMYNGLAVGASALDSNTLANNAFWRSDVRRLNSELFLIRVTGMDPSRISQRQVAALTRLQFIAMDINAGLTTRGQLKLGGSSFIDGVDDEPGGWGCPTSNDTLAGILTRDSSQISTSGCGSFNCVRGSPKIQPDPTINDSTFFKFGDLDWNELVGMATLRFNTSVGPLNGIAPVGTSTTCNTANTSNWGEPLRPAAVAGCVNYFPIIYVNGNLKLTGGRGQGILLVENDLDVQGGFEFFGPVIVRGNLTTQGTGGHFNGGVLAANADLQLSTVLGDAVITYSSCVISRALNANSPGRLLSQRSWAELIQ